MEVARQDSERTAIEGEGQGLQARQVPAPSASYDLALHPGRWVELRGLRVADGLYEYGRRSSRAPDYAPLNALDVVAMLPIVYDSEGKHEPHVVLTIQPRPVLSEQFGRLIRVADGSAGVFRDKRKGETEIEAGLREVAEENGLSGLHTVVKVGEFLTTPGLTNESAALYVGRLTASIADLLGESQSNIFGAVDELEQIERRLVPLSKFLDPAFSLSDGQIVECPKLSLYRAYLARNPEFAQFAGRASLPAVLEAFRKTPTPLDLTYDERLATCQALGVKTKHCGAHVDFRTVPVNDPRSGRKGEFEYLSRRCTGVASGIALDREGNVLLTLSLREPSGNAYVLDLPAGLYGGDRNPAQDWECGLRYALFKKLGYQFGAESSLTYLVAMPTTSGMVSEVVKIGLVRGLTPDPLANPFSEFPWIYPVSLPLKEFLATDFFARVREIPLGLPGNVRAQFVDPKVILAQYLLSRIDFDSWGSANLEHVSLKPARGG